MCPAGFFPAGFLLAQGRQEACTCPASKTAKRTSTAPKPAWCNAGILRSQFGETSEALFLTQGYVYDNSAQAEARFKGEDHGYQYSRFANPTVTMFEQRIAEFEGAEAARATATGMAAVTLSIMGQVKAGDHVVASKSIFGSNLYVVEDYLPRYGVSFDDRRRARSRRMARGDAAEHQDLLPGNSDQSQSRRARHRRDRQDRARRRRDADRRQRVLDAAVAEPARARRRLRGLFHHQAHRRPGPLPRRRDPRLAEVHQRQHRRVHPADRPVDVAVQRLGDAEGPGDAGGARAGADRDRRPRSRTRSPSIRRCRG